MAFLVHMNGPRLSEIFERHTLEELGIGQTEKDSIIKWEKNKEIWRDNDKLAPGVKQVSIDEEGYIFFPWMKPNGDIFHLRLSKEEEQMLGKDFIEGLTEKETQRFLGRQMEEIEKEQKEEKLAKLGQKWGDRKLAGILLASQLL